jgi:hypothetical protein
VNHYDQDLLRLMTRERCEHRVREADAERLAREIDNKTSDGTRLASALRRVHLTGKRTPEPRLET